MNPAEIAALLADLGARIEGAQTVTAAIEGRLVLVRFDATEAEALRARITAALAHLGRVTRIDVEIDSTSLVDSHDTPSGLPVVATIHGPHALGRTLPGRAVLEIVGPPRRSS